LGDNARSPYGTRSFEAIYEYTRQGVFALFESGCPLVIVACNTSSARALRTIQQCDLPGWGLDKRVLGVLRPSVEVVGAMSKTGRVGIFATEGTVRSGSYELELTKLFPHLRVMSLACPMLVPLVENGELDNIGVRYFIEKYLSELLSLHPRMDTLLLGCTHYSHLGALIRSSCPRGVTVVEQGALVAHKLKDYLERHPEMAERILKRGAVRFQTTELASNFLERSKRYWSGPMEVETVKLG
jgi:glutamate racemase